MLDREIRPGRICLVINSDREHNNGKVVEVIRWVGTGEHIPEFHATLSGDGGWLVKGGHLLQTFDSGRNPVYADCAFYYGEYLLPIDEFQEDLVEQKEEQLSV